jgi:hypothetical protein
MIRIKITLLAIIVAIVLVAIAGIITVKSNLSVKEHKAVQIAQEYLAKKYEQEMRYETVRFSWVDPGLYHVYFTSVDTEIQFEVYIWPVALSSPEDIEDGKYIWDDYVNCFLCRGLENMLSPEVRRIWDDNATISVRINNSNVYPNRGEVKFSGQMTAIEMEPYYNTEFHITAHRMLTTDLKDREAALILKMLQSVKLGGYQPREITFRYEPWENGGSEKYIWFGEGHDPLNSGRFEDWREIASVDWIIKTMDDQLFDKQ